MKKQKKIARLVKLSITAGKLDPKKILVIAKTLAKRELTLYYRLLLLRREEEKAYVYTAIDVPEDIARRLTKLFSHKDLVFLKDAQILSGIKVKVGDIIFDTSLVAYLEEMSRQVVDSALAGRRNHEVN